MKILIATDAYYPMINGVVTSTVILYEELKKMGHEVRILTLSSNKSERFENSIYYLKSIKINIYPDARIKYLSGSNIIKQIEEWSPDIIHTQTEFSVMLVAKKLASRLNIPLIHTYHTMYEDYTNFLIGSKKLNKKVIIKVVKQLVSNFSGVIAPTEKTTQTLLRYKVATPIYTIPTGLNLDKFNRTIETSEYISLKQKYDLINKKTLVYLGRISKEKNIDEIIHYIKNNKPYFNDKRFLIAGGGPYLLNLKKLVHNYALNDIVKFTDFINPDEVYKYYKLGEVFVTASTTETQGLTYIEAMACGIPVVCRNDDCVETLIKNNENGFKYTDENSFISSLNTIFSSNELYKTMCEKSKLKTNEYSSETFASNVLKSYTTLITAHNQNSENEFSFGNLFTEFQTLYNLKRNLGETFDYSKDKISFRINRMKDGTYEIRQHMKDRINSVRDKYKSS
ncbi:glycosyltransferase family 4 protein [Clostridium sediminicola]|uniref:glycosyltransferase family 4 protein n=1 Tax=Clostridium sediminicola TaxID=3114879 RepID=UPI0031F21D76